MPDKIEGLARGCDQALKASIRRCGSAREVGAGESSGDDADARPGGSGPAGREPHHLTSHRFRVQPWIQSFVAYATKDCTLEFMPK